MLLHDMLPNSNTKYLVIMLEISWLLIGVMWIHQMAECPFLLEELLVQQYHHVPKYVFSERLLAFQFEHQME